MPEWEGAEHLRRQVSIHAFLSEEGRVPVPGVRWSDETGNAFGRPAFLMQFVDGRPIVGDLDDPTAVEALAATSRRSASIGATPGWWMPTPCGRVVGPGDRCRNRRGADPSCYHGGNVLWDGTTVTAVLDWPLAAIGSPHYDEAYAHAWLAWGDETARHFRDRYRASSGSVLDEDRQRFWDLTAVVRFLPSPDSMGLVDTYRATGCADITSEQLDTRYVELAERLLA